LIAVRPNGVHGLEPGLYLRDVDGAWERLSAQRDIEGEWFGRNRELFERSHFAIFPVSAQATKDALIDAGTLGQILMEASPAHELGLCPIGEFPDDRVLEAAGLDGSIVHGWLCGRIDPAQTREWMAPPRPLRGEALVQRCRERVARHLPAYMHPARYLFLERVPLTGNEKVDRSKLRHHVRAQDADATPGRVRTANSEMEREIAAMLEGVLDRPAPDVERSFFETGISSLIIVRLYALINARYPDRIRFQDLFDHPSIRGVARLLDARQEATERRAIEVVDF
jgi:hypothetical protein